MSDKAPSLGPALGKEGPRSSFPLTSSVMSLLCDGGTAELLLQHTWASLPIHQLLKWLVTGSLQ